jgi:hypothetical protein
MFILGKLKSKSSFNFLGLFA